MREMLGRLGVVALGTMLTSLLPLNASVACVIRRAYLAPSSTSIVS